MRLSPRESVDRTGKENGKNSCVQNREWAWIRGVAY